MEKIILEVNDGTNMQAHISYPAKKSNLGIIVFQEAFGVNTHVKSIVKRFADEGYLTIAPELYHRTAPVGLTVGYDQFYSVEEHFNAVNEAGIHADVEACYNWLKSMGIQSIACIGHCLGGRVAYIANSNPKAQMSCAIAYYGGRIAPNYLKLADKQLSPLLFFWGGRDEHISNDDVQSINGALTVAMKKFTCVQFSDADHGFFCDERVSYNPSAAKESWVLTLQFLKENFKT